MDDEITSIIITLIIIMKNKMRSTHAIVTFTLFSICSLLYPFFHLKLCIFSNGFLLGSSVLWFSTVFENYLKSRILETCERSELCLS